MRKSSLKTLFSAALLFSVCFGGGVASVRDNCTDLYAGHVARWSNMESAEQWRRGIFLRNAFDGDEHRYSRSTQATGFIEYDVPKGIMQIAVDYYAYLGDMDAPVPSFDVEFFLDSTKDFDVSSGQLALLSKAQNKTNAAGFFQQQGDRWTTLIEPTLHSHRGWHAGSIVLQDDPWLTGCKRTLRIQINGGSQQDYWAYQISEVTILDVIDTNRTSPLPANICTFSAPAAEGCPSGDFDADQCGFGGMEADVASDDASDGLAGLHDSVNVAVIRDNSTADPDGSARYVPRADHLPSTIVYHYPNVTFYEVRILAAFRFATPEAVQNASLTVAAYAQPECRPAPSASNISDFAPVLLQDGWFYRYINHTVGPLPGSCDLPSYAEVTFFAKAGAEIQLMLVEFMGAKNSSSGRTGGAVSGNDTNGPPFWVWIFAAVVVMFVTGWCLTIWYWCNRWQKRTHDFSVELESKTEAPEVTTPSRANLADEFDMDGIPRDKSITLHLARHLALEEVDSSITPVRLDAS